MAHEIVNSCLNIMRRMPPTDMERNLAGLLSLAPELTDELLQRVDQPLKVATDAESGKQYLLCDYNRDGDSYRSPWSNKYDPPTDGFLPSDDLRQLEVRANELFDTYREQYFHTGVSSVYFWEVEGGFASCWLIKKTIGEGRFLTSGSWDSIHVLEVIPVDGRARARYKLTTTVMLTMEVRNAELGSTTLSGTLERQAEAEEDVTAVQSHIVNMGRMVEGMESTIRSQLDTLYLAKTYYAIASIRSAVALSQADQRAQAALAESLRKHVPVLGGSREE